MNRPDTRPQSVKDAEADAATLLTVVLNQPWESGEDAEARLIDAYMDGQAAAAAMLECNKGFKPLLHAQGFAITAARAAFRAVPGLRGEEGGR